MGLTELCFEKRDFLLSATPYSPAQDPMVEVIELQQQKLSVARLQQLRANLAHLHSKYDGKLIVGTGNSGCDVIIKVLADLAKYWALEFGLCFEIEHAFSCDHGDVQQDWITGHFQPDCLFRDMEELASESAFDVLSGAVMKVPTVCVFATGIECDTLAQCNQQKRIGESVVLKGEGKTGKSAVSTMDYVKAKGPDLLLFECVKGLASAPKASDGPGMRLSDLDMVISLLNKQGYIFWTDILDAHTYGFPVARERCYALGVRVLPPDESFTQLPQKVQGQDETILFEFPSWWHELHNVMQELKLRTPLMINRFFLNHMDERRSRWQHFPALGSLDRPTPEPKKNKTGNHAVALWEADHLTAFQEAHLPWPPIFTEKFTDKTRYLCRRKAEIVWYYENSRDKEVLADAFCDINYSIAWSKLTISRTACLVGSSHVWCFGRSVDCDFMGEQQGLDLAGEEAMALQGFSVQSQNKTTTGEISPQDTVPLSYSSHAFHCQRKP